MNNEELKKKIVEIINDGIIHGEDNFGMPTSKTIENIADALIEAGVVDKSDYASMKETAVKYKAEVSKAEAKAKEAEHRAEVAQLIAERACELVFSEEINDEDWVNVIFNYKKEKGIREIGITTNILYDYLKDQAEKELAEEWKDE